MWMRTIKNDITYQLIIKNSKFITLLYKIKSNDDIDSLIAKTREIYPDATHYCYAYITDDSKKCSDDGEPSGTAGIPILKVLENSQLTNVLCIIVRYFGGIKLGANGLIRAYTKCTSNAIKETTLTELKDGINITLTFPYSRIKEVDYLLKDIKINHKTYGDMIIYDLDIENEYLEVLKNNQFDYEIIKMIKIEK